MKDLDYLTKVVELCKKRGLQVSLHPKLDGCEVEYEKGRIVSGRFEYVYNELEKATRLWVIVHEETVEIVRSYSEPPAPGGSIVKRSGDLDFGTALRLLKAGYKVVRSCWNAPVSRRNSRLYWNDDPNLPYLSESGGYDLLAEDWCVVDDF